MGSGKQGVVGVVVTKVALLFQEMKNTWISAQAGTVCWTYDGLQPGRGEAAGLAQAGGHTLSGHREPLRPSALVRWLAGVLSTVLVCTGKKTKTKHLLTQISLTLESW